MTTLPSRASRILVVDDDPLLIASIKAPLLRAGYEVRALLSAANEALSEAVQWADAVILDVAMPDCDGFSALASLRADEATRHKPVLMLTAHDPMAYRLRGLALGADDYMLKPPNHQELVLRIESLLRRADSAANSKIVGSRGGRNNVLLDARQIVFVKAARNYCYLHTRDAQVLCTEGIEQLAKRLGSAFVRTHRSFLVNSAYVLGASWRDRSTYVLEVDTAERTAVPVSRRYRSEVRSTLGFTASDEGTSACPP